MTDTINTSLNNLNNAGCCITNQSGFAVQPVPVSEAAPGFSTIVPNANPCQAMPGGGKKKKKKGGKKKTCKKGCNKSKKKMGGNKSKKKMGGARRKTGVKSAPSKKKKSKSNSSKALSGNNRPVNRQSVLPPVPRQNETMAQFRRRMRRRRTTRTLPRQINQVVTSRRVFTPPNSPTGGKNRSKKSKSKSKK